MLNPNKEIVQDCLAALRKNKEIYGKPYCPCILPTQFAGPRAQDYICPCKDFRERVESGGECNCGLYIKDDAN